MTVGSHLTTDVIADLLEGLLGESDRVSAEAHLASCAECLAVADTLVEVRDVLRVEGGVPPPMPDDVTERLTAALAVESASRADSTGVVSLGQARERKLSRKAAQFLVVAASVAVLGVAGGVVVNSITKDDPITAITNPSTSPTTAVAGAPAGKLYLDHNGTAALESTTFAKDAAKLLTIEKPPRPGRSDPGISHAATPEECIRGALPSDSGSLRDFASISFERQLAYLAITNPTGTDVIRAYAITCDGDDGTVVHQATLDH